MQASLQTAGSLVGSESRNGRYIAEFLPYASDWMTGTIVGRSFQDDEARRIYVDDVLDAIQEVSDEQQRYSTCTDGRKRLQLADGTPVPLREQLVGTDTMAALVAAEALGTYFYGSELYAAIDTRIRKVVQHMLDNDYMPTAHIACGAAGGFTTVMNRSTQFIKDKSYVDRLTKLCEGHYNQTLHYLIVGSYQSRLVSDAYKDYRDGLVAEIVQDMVGPQAVEMYDDDGRGVHGHREQAIVYLDQSMRGLAINPNRLITATDSQLFGVNGSRIDAIARLMSGEDHGITYATARLAIEDFSSAGHGTLASQMETMLVRLAS